MDPKLLSSYWSTIVMLGNPRETKLPIIHCFLLMSAIISSNIFDRFLYVCRIVIIHVLPLCSLVQIYINITMTGVQGHIDLLMVFNSTFLAISWQLVFKGKESCWTLIESQHWAGKLAILVKYTAMSMVWTHNLRGGVSLGGSDPGFLLLFCHILVSHLIVRKQFSFFCNFPCSSRLHFPFFTAQ